MNLRNLRTDRSGGIEGLPLQLMIVILVATMGTAIIVGWMGNIDAPNSIGDVEVDDVVHCKNGIISDFSIEVRDQNGDYLPGALVIIENSYIEMTVEGGDPVRAVETTDDTGKASFGPLTVNPPSGVTHFVMNLEVSKTDYGEKSVDVTVVID